MSSRLFQEVREKRGLAYSVFSFISPHVDTGMFGVYLAVSPEKALSAVELVLREISRLRDEKVDASELRGAIEYTKGNLLLASESADNQMVRIAQNEILYNRDIPIDTLLASVESVTVEEIQQMAETVSHRDRMVLTLLGPVETPQLAFERSLLA
jgi:predicted Zn-dependent peptidase